MTHGAGGAAATKMFLTLHCLRESISTLAEETWNSCGFGGTGALYYPTAANKKEKKIRPWALIYSSLEALCRNISEGEIRTLNLP